MPTLINSIKNFFFENRCWLKFTAIWFAATALIGAVVFFIQPDLLDRIVALFTQKFGASPALDSSLAQQIFNQNAIVCGIALFGGLLLGILPAIIVGVNGFLLGFVAMAALSIGNPLAGVIVLIVGVVPHGLFEVPAFLVSASLGLRLGLEWLGGGASGQRWNVLKQNFINSVGYFAVIVVLLFLAAMIEVFVSGHLVDKF